MADNPFKELFLTVNEHYLSKGMYSLHPITVYKDKEGKLRNRVLKAIAMDPDEMRLIIFAHELAAARMKFVTYRKKNQSLLDSFQVTLMVVSGILENTELPQGVTDE